MKLLLTRVDDLAAQNDRLSHEHQQDLERLYHANDVLTGDIKRLTQENERLSLANEELNKRLSRANAALEQRVERLEAVNSQQTTALNPSPEPDTRSQFTAFACTLSNVNMACPNNRTILTKSGVYGLFYSPNSDCSGCCAPNPQYDCTELVEENSPADWLAIQAVCDGQEMCQFEAPGTALGDCSGQLSDYMQLFYDCLPDDETGPVAFTAWANTGNPTSYSADDIIVFDQVLTNAGGHYNAATSSFICPWDGIYLMSVNMEGGESDDIHVELMRNNIQLARLIIDNISGYNRGSTTIVTECDRGDVVWVRCYTSGTIWALDKRNMFTGHILHRF